MLYFDEKEDWHKNLTDFNSICGELTIHDQELPDREKKSKLIRCLPSSFSALSMLSPRKNMSFEDVVSAVQAEFPDVQIRVTLIMNTPGSSPKFEFIYLMLLYDAVVDEREVTGK